MALAHERGVGKTGRAPVVEQIDLRGVPRGDEPPWQRGVGDFQAVVEGKGGEGGFGGEDEALVRLRGVDCEEEGSACAGHGWGAEEAG